MKKIVDFIVKNKGIVLLVFGVLVAVAIVGTVFLTIDENKVNSDMMSYLDDSFDTQKGLVFLQENFGVRGDGILIVRGTDEDEELRETVQKIKSIKGVNRLLWVEDAIALEELQQKVEGTEIPFTDEQIEVLKNAFNEEALASLDLSGYADLFALLDIQVETAGLRDYLKKPVEGTDYYDYALILMIDYAPSTQKAYDLMDEIKALFSDREYAASGMTETAEKLMNGSLREIPYFLLFAVLAVVVILLLTTSSFIDPLIILTTLAVGILVSMGINYLYPSISVISFSTGAVLQLAITLDYAIFYMHAYKKKRREFDAVDATKRAVPEAAGSILASGLTTMGGFAALFFMRFKIGSDIAGVIIKGVATSILTILILQPVLTLLLDKVIEKTSHRFIASFNEKRKAKKPDAKPIEKDLVVRPVAKFSVLARIVLVVVAAALFVPAYFGQSGLRFSYLTMYEDEADTPEEIYAEQLGNEMIIAVPLDTVSGTHYDFIEDLKKDPYHKISGVVSVFSQVKNLDVKALRSALELLRQRDASTSINSEVRSAIAALQTDTVRDLLIENGLPEETYDELIDLHLEEVDYDAIFGEIDLGSLSNYFSEVNGKWYVLYTLSVSGSCEDDAALKTYDYVTNARRKYFGKDGYSIGLITGSSDLAATTPTDFLRVTIAGIVIIFLIVTVLLRNPLKSLLLVAIIELGIWLNLSLMYLTGQTINFITYIIISSIQLGVTVDYAILLANTFEKKRGEYKTGKECAVAAAAEAVPTIFISAILIASVCLVVHLVSENVAIKQLTAMLAIGAAIAFLLVSVLQTAVMSFFKTEKKKVDYGKKLQEIEEAIEKSKDEPQGAPDEGNSSEKKGKKSK